MKTFQILILLLLASLIAAEPSRYNILKLPSGVVPIVDGDISEWNESFFIDSLHSDDNVFGRDTLIPWTPDQFQYKLYLAYSTVLTDSGIDTGYVYGAAIITRDPDYIVTKTYHALSGDNMRICTGSTAQSFYIPSNGNAPLLNPSSPFVTNRTLFGRCKTYGNAGVLPIYEFALRKDILLSNHPDTFRACFGSMDINSYQNSIVLAVGAFYQGAKQYWIYEPPYPPENSIYHPLFQLSQEMGNSTEFIKMTISATVTIAANPNPFNPLTKISFNCGTCKSGNIKVFNANGKMLLNKNITGSGYFIWNAVSLPSAVYLCRLETEGKTIVRRLMLAK